MSECEKLQEDLKAYLDGQSALPSYIKVILHLATCPACREERRVMKRISRELRAGDRGDLEPDLRARILANIPDDGSQSPAKSEAMSRLQGRPARRALWRATAVVILAYFTLYSFNNHSHILESRATSSFGSAARHAESPLAPSPVEAFSTLPASGRNVSLAVQTKSIFLKSNGEEKPTPAMPKPQRETRLTPEEHLDAMATSERKVHKAADITLETAMVEPQSEQVAALVTAAGGYVAENQLTTGDDNTKSASLTTKVPVAQFDTVLDKITHLGDVKAKNVTGEDVTEKMSDEQEAEQVLQEDISETQSKLRERQNHAQRTEDARTLRELKIRNAQSEARLRLLKKLSVMADITVTVNEKPKTPKPIKTGGFWNDMSDTAHDATQTFLQAVRLPIMLLVWLLVYAPVWLLLMLGYRYAVRR